MEFTNKTNFSAIELPKGKKEFFFWDDDLPGFGLRLRGGTRRWYCQYRVGAQQRRESLGDIRKVTLDAARDIARKRFAKVELGTDPAAEKAKAKVEATANKLTVEKVAERYIRTKEGEVRPRTLSQIKLHLKQHFKPLANRPIGAIKRIDVAEAVQDLIEGHGRTSAARARSNLSGMFSWAMQAGLVENNPVTNSLNPDTGKARERVLSDQELVAVWNACLDDDFGRIVKLCILTGTRREEIGHLKWSEVNLDTRIMSVPGERVKNHRDLALILPPMAIDIIKAQPRRADRDYLFGGGRDGFSAWSYYVAALRGRLADAGKFLPDWTLHDLRRTFRTGLGRLGVPPHIAELCINHAKDGIVAVYDKHRYEPEIKAALELWANHIVLHVT